MRDNGPAPKRVHVSESRDRGETWTTVIDKRAAQSRHERQRPGPEEWPVALVYNDLERGRQILAISLSSDEGPHVADHAASRARPRGGDRGCDRAVPLPVHHPVEGRLSTSPTASSCHRRRARRHARGGCSASRSSTRRSTRPGSRQATRQRDRRPEGRRRHDNGRARSPNAPDSGPLGERPLPSTPGSRFPDHTTCSIICSPVRVRIGLLDFGDGRDFLQPAARSRTAAVP